MKIERVLALDIAGNPYKWLDPKDAVTLYAMDKVAWDLGDTERVFRGGFSGGGEQSSITIKSIVAVAKSHRMVSFALSQFALPERDNTPLFKRDRDLCAYCGKVFHRKYLTRDHIHPRSKGGANTWMNCVTACLSCNQAKADKLVHEFKPLLYLPYVPNRAEYFILSGRSVLADQMDYLTAQLPRESRLRH